MISALRRRRWSLAWLLVIIGLGVLLGWLASVPLLASDSPGRDGVRVGEPAPTLALRDLDGATWDLADVDAPLVWVNFWAASCEPCRTEMPAMQRIAEAYGDDVAVLGVNWGEDPERAADFAERLGITYPILLDPGLEAFYAWAGTDGLPRHYFIGPEGTVLREIVGPLDPARMVEIVDELLATSSVR